MALLPPAVRPVGQVCVVVDVLRASSTVTVALGRGARHVLPVASLGEARRLKRLLPDHLLCGERGGLPPRGFDLGNSPREFLATSLEGRGLVLTTSNGTRLLRRLEGAAAVFVGCLLNRRAVARAALTEAAARGTGLLVVCAGEGGGRRLALEDVLGAGAIVDAALAWIPAPALGEGARLARLAFLAAAGGLTEALRSAAHGRYLVSLGLGEDVDYCARLDAWTVVPRLERGEDGPRLVARPQGLTGAPDRA